MLQALFPPGVITYDRLVELAGEIKSISSDDIMRAFKTFDLNGDNFISLTELRVLLQKVILEQLSRLRNLKRDTLQHTNCPKIGNWGWELLKGGLLTGLETVSLLV